MAVRLRPVVVCGGGGCERIAELLLRRNYRSLVAASLQLTNRTIRPICLRAQSSSAASSTSSSSSSVSIVLRRVQLTLSSAQQRSGYSTLSSSPPPPSAAVPSSPSSGHDEIVVERLDGLPVLSVPMPSRHEKCRFVLKPLANTLSDFVAFLKAEDSAVERVTAYAEEGDVIPGRTSVEVLFRRNFYLHINNDSYLVRAPEQPADDLVIADGRVDDLSSVKDTVARLFRAIHSDKIHADQQLHLQARLEEVKVQLEPMEKVRLELHDRAIRRGRVLSWVGLGLMGLQFGFLARLTWWEYSWDIMEPVTYFVTCGTAMAMYAYHVLTIQDYAYPDAHDREVVMAIHRLARKNGALDVVAYNRLRAEKLRLQFDIDRLRHPLQVKLHPPHLPPPTSRPTVESIAANEKNTDV